MRFPVLFRRIYRLSRLGLHVLWGVLLIISISNLVKPARWDKTISRWSARLLEILRVRLSVVHNNQQVERALLVANHISWLDIFVIHAARRVHFVSKSEVRHWPVAGWLAWKSGTLFIERNRRADTLRINQEMRAILDEGGWVAVFPEGTTSDGKSLRPFKSSLLQPAADLSLPVIPAGLSYRTADGAYTNAANYIDDMSFAESLWKIAGEPAIHAQLSFGQLASGTDRRQLASMAEAEVSRLLGFSPTGSLPVSAENPPDAVQ